MKAIRRATFGAALVVTSMWLHAGRAHASGTAPFTATQFTVDFSTTGLVVNLVTDTRTGTTSLGLKGSTGTVKVNDVANTQFPTAALLWTTASPTFIPMLNTCAAMASSTRAPHFLISFELSAPVVVSGGTASQLYVPSTNAAVYMTCITGA